MTFTAPDAVLRYVIEKGSICVNGVSLTVTAFDEQGFSVSIIPHTLRGHEPRLAPARRPRQPRVRPVRQVRRAAAARARARCYPDREMSVDERYKELYPELRDSPFATIEEAIADIRAGRMVVVVDSPDRENEGDLVMAAECVTPEAINFMARHARGLICLTLTPERCDELGLPMMTQLNRTPYGTAFTVSIEARSGVSTGISAADRAHTIRVAVDPATRPEDLIQPGHVFPLRARPHGVLERTGQTEASVDLARMAGFSGAGVICEVMNDDGDMARVPDLVAYCEQHGLKMMTVADLIAYRHRSEKLVERIASAQLPTRYGDFVAHGYRSMIDGQHHVALVMGDVDGAQDVLVRVHSECVTGDVFHSLRCDCGEQLERALSQIAEEGAACCCTWPRRGAASAC